MKTFTISRTNKLVRGVTAVAYTLGENTESPKVIPIVFVGEKGRGREFSFLPVTGAKPEETINFAEIEATRKNGKKIVKTNGDSNHECLVVLRTGMGFRGGSYVCFEGDTENRLFEESVICSGMIAEGNAGAMGRSKQYILKMPSNAVLSIQLTGRMYDAPNHYYALFDGNDLQYVSAQERQLLDW